MPEKNVKISISTRVCLLLSAHFLQVYLYKVPLVSADIRFERLKYSFSVVEYFQNILNCFNLGNIPTIHYKQWLNFSTKINHLSSMLKPFGWYSNALKLDGNELIITKTMWTCWRLMIKGVSKAVMSVYDLLFLLNSDLLSFKMGLRFVKFNLSLGM